jgi:hypothetical protein
VEEAVIDAETESHERNACSEPQDTAFEKALVLFLRYVVGGGSGYFN